MVTAVVICLVVGFVLGSVAGTALAWKLANDRAWVREAEIRNGLACATIRLAGRRLEDVLEPEVIERADGPHTIDVESDRWWQAVHTQLDSLGAEQQRAVETARDAIDRICSDLRIAQPLTLRDVRHARAHLVVAVDQLNDALDGGPPARESTQSQHWSRITLSTPRTDRLD